MRGSAAFIGHERRGLRHGQIRQANGVEAVERAVYTVREVAHLLSLSLGMTYTLVREGEIPAMKMGGRWVVPKRRFHAWLDADDGPPDDRRDWR